MASTDFKHYKTYGTVCQFSSSVFCHQHSPIYYAIKKTLIHHPSHVFLSSGTLKLNQTLCDSLQSYPSISQIPLTEDIVY